jgi:uncharacterized protein GlcG (DUF336 family)
MALRNKIILISTVAWCMNQAAYGQALSHKDMSYEMAKTIAEGALEKCLSEGYAVSSVVVDRDGETIVALRGDNAAPHTIENARRKAYTAMAFKTPTTAYAKKFADKDPTVLQQVTLPNIIAIGGGLPIKIGKEILGGAGISGSPGVDEGCTQAGIDKVKDQLQ